MSLELLDDLGVLPVEVRLLGGEQVEVPLAVGHPGPGGAAEDRLPVVGRLGAVRARDRAGRCTAPARAARAGRQRRLEPLVLVGGVVGDDVDDDPEAQVVRVARCSASASARVPNSGSMSR